MGHAGHADGGSQESTRRAETTLRDKARHGLRFLTVFLVNVYAYEKHYQLVCQDFTSSNSQGLQKIQ
jgi:hypothetical protein